MAVDRWAGGMGSLGLIAACSYAFAVGTDDGVGATVASVALGALAFSAYLGRESLARALKSRSLQHGAGAAWLVLTAAGIGIGGYVVARQHDHRWDLTGKGQFTVSSYTAGVLRKLDHDVTVYGVFRENSSASQAFDRLFEGYREITPHLRIERVDPVKDPLRARSFVEKYGLTEEDGTVIFVDGDSWRKLEGEFNEERVTNALVKLPSDADRRLCWVVGHSEADPDDDSGETGYGAVVLKLEDLNYAVVKTEILKGGIPVDCAALLLMDPRDDLLPAEREAIAAFVAGGGRLLVTLEPTASPELTNDLLRYGVAVGQDIVLEASREHLMQGFDPSVLVIGADGYGAHPITTPLRSRAFLEGARSVTPVEPADNGLRVVTLARSSDASWGESTLDFATSTPAPDPATDLVGPVSIGVAVEVQDPAAIPVAKPAAAPVPETSASLATGSRTAPATAPTIDVNDASKGVAPDFAPKAGGRLVVFGDASFATNAYMTLENNQDLLFNAIAWLVDAPEQLGEHPEEGAQTLPMNAVESALLALIALVFVPGAAAAVGALTLLRRRFL